MPDLTLDDHRAAVRANRIDRLAALLLAQFRTYTDCDPLLVEELSDALAAALVWNNEGEQP